MSSGKRCDNCFKVISGQYIDAFNQRYHPDCFVCHHCQRPFPSGKYFTYRDRAYCREDFENMCPKCHKVCDGVHIKYENQKIHERCFVCTMCRDRLGGGTQYFSLEGTNGKMEPYCKKDYEVEKRLREGKYGSGSGQSDSPAASRSKPTSSSSPSQSQSQSSSLASSRGSSSAAAASSASKPATKAKVCKWCKEEIDGDCLKLGEDRYHNHCFKCIECKLLISKTEDFFETKDESGILCSSCHEYLCVECDKVISGTHTFFGGKRYHDSCFKCAKCRSPLDPKSFYELKGRQLCKKDYEASK